MKIVILEANSVGTDISFHPFEEFGEVVVYPSTLQEQVPERVADADIVILNKLKMNEAALKDAKNLKLICLTATGTDCLDKEYLASRQIAWRNVAGYSTNLVAQHTFALLFYVMENLAYFDDYVKGGEYTRSGAFSTFAMPVHELYGKTYGIIGMGAIGRKVAEIASAFGCKVIYYSTSGENLNQPYEAVGFEELLSRSDIVSVHAPLNEQTKELMNYEAFCKMKPSAFFVNVGRGAIVEESGLRRALEEDRICAAALDVLATEPMPESSPLYGYANSSKLLITPHVAWIGYETRTHLMKCVEENVREFLATC